MMQRNKKCQYGCKRYGNLPENRSLVEYKKKKMRKKHFPMISIRYNKFFPFQ